MSNSVLIPKQKPKPSTPRPSLAELEQENQMPYLDRALGNRKNVKVSAFQSSI